MLEINYTFLIQMGFFLSFMAVVNLLLFRPMRAYLARRQETLRSLGSGATDLESSLARMTGEHERKIAAARDEIFGLRSTARKEALDLQKSLLEESRRQTVIEVDAAEDELEREVAAARAHLQQESQALAASIAQKVLGRSSL